jgi:hypothetical protein
LYISHKRRCPRASENILSLITVGNATNFAVVLCVHVPDDEMRVS